MQAAGSDRGFGLLFAAVSAVAGAVAWFRNGAPPAALLAVSAVLLTVAIFAPGLLAPFNRAWTRLGLLLARVVNPVVLAALFFTVVTPTGLLLRLLGKDPLRLRRGRAGRELLDPPPAAGSGAGVDEEPVLRSAMDFLREFYAFIRVRKKYWLLPVIVLSLVLGGLFVLSSGSAMAPMIYTIF